MGVVGPLITRGNRLQMVDAILAVFFSRPLAVLVERIRRNSVMTTANCLIDRRQLDTDVYDMTTNVMRV